MIMKSKKRNFNVLLCIIFIAVLLIVLKIVLLTIYNRDDYEPQENIYFLKYDSSNTMMTTVVFKYDQVEDKVVEIGTIQGFFSNCTINEEETCITGILSAKRSDQEINIGVYDIKTGIIQTTEATEEIKELASGRIYWGNIFFYDGGNKILLYYDDENKDEWWLFYDFTTGEYERIPGDDEGTSQFLAVENNIVWYYTWKSGIVYRYDLEAQTRTEVTTLVENAAFDLVTEKIAYKKSMEDENIYLYDVSTKNSKCIARGSVITTHPGLHYIYARWSDDGRQFFYIKRSHSVIATFIGSTGYADVSLMVYDAGSGRRQCFYKEDNITNQFQYVSKR